MPPTGQRCTEQKRRIRCSLSLAGEDRDSEHQVDSMIDNSNIAALLEAPEMHSLASG